MFTLMYQSPRTIWVLRDALLLERPRGVIYTTSIRKVMRRFVIREIVRGSFFRVFFLELQLEENRGGRNFCNINLSWERRRE